MTHYVELTSAKEYSVFICQNMSLRTGWVQNLHENRESTCNGEPVHLLILPIGVCSYDVVSEMKA